MLRIIGDVHGKINEYKDLINGVEYSIQVGDVGYNYSPLLSVDSARHKFVGGNHDSYHQLPPHYLGDFGILPYDNFAIFYVRGAYSIDWAWRIQGIDLFKEEELKHCQFEQALSLYSEYASLTSKKIIFISHECPCSIFNVVINNNRDIPPSFTARYLDRFLKVHKPYAWIFGHHHRDLDWISGGSIRFICLNELSYVDIDTKGEISGITIRTKEC